MPEPPSDPPKADLKADAQVPPPAPSNFSLKLQQAPEPPPKGPPNEPRQELAQKRVGETLKSWRIVRLLGVGPLTASYEVSRGAKDAKEQAVLKLLVGAFATNERAKNLFLRAAYAANRFNHSRVLPIVEDGVDASGAAFVVRPWANALPLSEVVAKGPLDEPSVLRVAEQILDALEMAHAHGIVHGAITPTNILVTERRSMRLCDFAIPPGLATTRAADDDPLASRRVGPFTAPERCGAMPQPPTEASDVWAVAACMYYALTGKHPRGDATSTTDLATARVRPLRELASQVNDSLDKIIAHALQLDPGARYESAYAMLGDVRRVMAGRKPKLGDASAPVPSASLVDVPHITQSPSSRRVPTGSAAREPASAGKSALSASLAQRRRKEARGNVMLILAIALLVGVATFVLVREKVHEERNGGGGTEPSTSEAP